MNNTKDNLIAERDRLRAVNAQLLAALKRAEQLARGMGNIIRELDEENEHLEFWNNDGEYLPCSEYSDIRAAITVAEQAGKGESQYQIRRAQIEVIKDLKDAVRPMLFGINGVAECSEEEFYSELKRGNK